MKYTVPPRPCATCPYAVSTPAGIWHASEYGKLVDYDLPTALQPGGVFLCHNGDAQSRICKGWLACHGEDLLGYRLAVMRGELDPTENDFTCAVQVYSSGREALIAGVRAIRRPSAPARAAIRKLTRQRRCRGHAKTKSRPGHGDEGDR